MNRVGFYSLFRHEVHRVFKVINQAIFPPIVSSLLFLAIFTFVLGRDSQVGGYSYLEFLVPGLIMMSTVNSAYQNSAFSLFISKYSGHIRHLLTMPLSYLELASAYVAGATARAAIAAVGIFVATLLFVPANVEVWWALLLFFVLASIIFASVGVIVALWAEQFDQVGLIITFLLMPMSMLGGVFYSIENLPVTFQAMTRFNPIFYLVDGLRYGMLGIADAPIWQGVVISSVLAAGTFLLAVYLVRRGWRIKE